MRSPAQPTETTHEIRLLNLCNLAALPELALGAVLPGKSRSGRRHRPRQSAWPLAWPYTAHQGPDVAAKMHQVL